MNGIVSSEDGSSSLVTESLGSSTSSKTVVRQRSSRCSLIKEELCEEDEDGFIENGFGFDEVKMCQSANELSLSDSHVWGNSSPSSQSAAITNNTKLLQTVHSMPQLMLNQISEEDEEEETTDSFSAYPWHQPMFSIASAGNFGGCARKANRKSSTKATVSGQSGMVLEPNLSQKSSHNREKDLRCVVAKETLPSSRNVKVEAEGRPLVEQRRIGRGVTDDKDGMSSMRAEPFSLRHEPVLQHSLLQGTSDTEDLADDHADSSVSCGMTNSLDRRLFQNTRKDGKCVTGRSIVGAVKKSVGMLLGHLSAVGDVTTAKPRHIETWSSCSDLMQASAKLCGADGANVNLADRHRMVRCQLARELRQNRSEREAQFSDAKKSQSSSRRIRVRSRDFGMLVSKFTTGDQAATAIGIKTDAS